MFGFLKVVRLQNRRIVWFTEDGKVLSAPSKPDVLFGLLKVVRLQNRRIVRFAEDGKALERKYCLRFAEDGKGSGDAVTPGGWRDHRHFMREEF